MALLRIALSAAGLFAFVACSTPPQSAAPASQATAVPATRPPASPAAAVVSPTPAGSPAPASAGVTSDAEAVQELRATRDGYMQAQTALQAGRRAEALELMT